MEKKAAMAIIVTVAVLTQVMVVSGAQEDRNPDVDLLYFKIGC
jgi:hypothetical protein